MPAGPAGTGAEPAPEREMRRLDQSARQKAIWSDRVEKSKTGAADKGYVGHKAAKMMKRAKAVESRRTQAVQEKKNF